MKQQACFESGAAVQKDRYIRLYVAALLHEQGPGFDALAAQVGLSDLRSLPVPELAEHVPDEFEMSVTGDPEAFLRRIAWKIDAALPFRSFIVQDIDLTRPDLPQLRKSALLCDSCQYAHRPGLIPNAWKSYPLVLNCGATGQMLPDQLRLIRRWREAEPERWAVVMCHHPFDALAPRTRSSLGWLWRNGRVSAMVTAHTHHGHYVQHDLGDETDYLELNLGSTTDWPMEWRTLQSFVDPDSRRFYERSERHTLGATLRNESGYFLTGWEVPFGAPDDYRRYKQGQSANALLLDFDLAYHLAPYRLPAPAVRANAAAKETENQVKDTLLWTYVRLLDDFPTDPTVGAPRWPEGCHDDAGVRDRILASVGDDTPLLDKSRLLVTLAEFERSRRTRDPETGASSDEARARFKLSAAAWASRFMYSKGRRLEVEDELIRVRLDRQGDAAGR